jgi:hypothetical protein
VSRDTTCAPHPRAESGERCSLSPLAAASGEMVGVRGLSTGADSSRVKVPCHEAQTRGEAPSPGICAKSAQIPTSPRKRGEVRLPGCHLS